MHASRSVEQSSERVSGILRPRVAAAALTCGWHSSNLSFARSQVVLDAPPHARSITPAQLQRTKFNHRTRVHNVIEFIAGGRATPALADALAQAEQQVKKCRRTWRREAVGRAGLPSVAL